MRRHSVRLHLIVVITVVLGAEVFAISPELFKATPDDALAAVYFDLPDPPADAKVPSAQWLRAATGILATVQPDGAASLTADAFAGITALGNRPLALVVVDAGAQELSPGSYRLARLEAALIVDTGGDHARITQRIQAILSSHTSPATTQIVTRRMYDTDVHTLTDSRLPAWATLHWAALGERYVIALGWPAFEAVAMCATGSRRPLATNETFAANLRKAGGDTAQIACWIDLARCRDRLAPVVAGRTKAVLDALGLDDVDQALWCIGRDSRAIVASAIYHTKHGDRFIPIALAEDDQAKLDRMVPAGAEAYAVVAYPPGRLIQRVVRAYLSSRRAAWRTDVAAAWAAMEEAGGFSTQSDLLDHLGERLVIHTFPPHPLGIPLLVTVMFEIDDAPIAVRSTLDAILTQCAQWLTRDEAADTTGGRDLLRPRLAREDDLWYVQFGIYGPAVAVTQDWVVISFSPYAVRQNLTFLQPAASPTPPADTKAPK